MLREFSIFGIVIGFLQLMLGTPLALAVVYGIGGGMGAVMGAMMHRIRPWFARPQTKIGWAIAIGLLVGNLVVFQLITALTYNVFNPIVFGFLIQVASVYVVRRFFLAIDGRFPPPQ